MTKAVVAQKVCDRTGMSRKDTMDAIEIFLESVKDALKQRRKVSLVGFGTFYVKEKKSRNGRNPRTGERIYIPPKLVATFKPGKAFREMVNGGQVGPAGADDLDDDGDE
jgi:DNA-binding protein HU-beta